MIQSHNIVIIFVIDSSECVFEIDHDVDESYQVRSGRLSVISKGNFAKWLWDKLRVVREGGKLPGSTSFRWFLSKFNQISRRKDLKKLGGTLVKSFSPKKIVLTVSFRCKKLISSNSAISFLEKKKMLNKMSFHCFKKLSSILHRCAEYLKDQNTFYLLVGGLHQSV